MKLADIVDGQDYAVGEPNRWTPLRQRVTVVERAKVTTYGSPDPYGTIRLRVSYPGTQQQNQWLAPSQIRMRWAEYEPEYLAQLEIIRAAKDATARAKRLAPEVVALLTDHGVTRHRIYTEGVGTVSLRFDEIYWLLGLPVPD